jgi:hypothetical protein
LGTASAGDALSSLVVGCIWIATTVAAEPMTTVAITPITHIGRPLLDRRARGGGGIAYDAASESGGTRGESM